MKTLVLKMNLTTNITRLLIISVFLVFVHVKPINAQTDQKLYVTIRDAKGDVEILKADTDQWVPVKEGSIFSEGVQVRTGHFSSASLVFADSSYAVIDSFAYLTLKTFSITENTVNTSIFLSVGAIVSALNENLSFKNKYSIKTPTSTTLLNGSEIKKVVAGAMYRDTVRTGYKKGIGAADQKAGEIAREKDRLKESSISPPK